MGAGGAVMNSELIQSQLPETLAEAVSDYCWQRVMTGCSTAQVFRLEGPTGDCLYLKTAPREYARDLWQEKRKLEWLQGRLPVPEVRLFVEDESDEYLLLSGIPGVTASDNSLTNDIPEVIEQLAAGLAMIHNLPVSQCPFDARLPVKIELAREQMGFGPVDESDFDESRMGRTAADLFDELIRTIPDSEDLVFTHGDYCLPNVILRGGKLAGFIDWGRAGVADRYQDIALAARSVGSNFGSRWVPALFEACGIRPDYAKIHFYTLLDEFF